MGKKEYLDASTAKIFNSDAKVMVTTELESHIDERTDSFREIGYDDETSEQKATQLMGETDTVAAQFGELHNDFYNPVFDIIYFVVWTGLLGGLFYLFKEYVFGDCGLSSLLLSGVCLSFALMTGYSVISLFRNRLLPIIFSFFGTVLTGVFNYFLLVELDKNMGKRFSNLISFIFSTDIPDKSNYYDTKKIILCISLFSVVAILTFLFSLIYYIKVKRLDNTKTDNKVMHLLVRFSAVLAVVAFVFCVLFSVKCYFDLNKWKNEYKEAYEYVMALSQNCSTKEEIIDYVNKSDYPFEEHTAKDGSITGFGYSHNLVYIDISFDKIDSREELKADYIESVNSTMEKLDKIMKDTYKNSAYTKSEVYKKIFVDYKAKLLDDMDRSIDIYYYDQNFCTIFFTEDLDNFNSSYDLISTSFLRVSEKEEEIFRLPENNTDNNSKKYDFYTHFKPTKFQVYFRLSDYMKCRYDFSYVFGKGDYKHVEECSAYRNDENTEKLCTVVDHFIDVAKHNPDKTPQELAKLTGARLEIPEVTEDEYDKMYSALGKVFDNVKENSYDVKTKFVFDDCYFAIAGRPYQIIFAYGKYGKLIDIAYVSASDVYINTTDDKTSEKRVTINGKYYDKLGRVYSDSDYVPYYTSDGRKFYFYCKTIEDKTHTSGDTKEYYLTDRKSAFYKTESCYIDEDGYLYFNNGNLKYDEDSGKFKSSNGHYYTKAFETSWDTDGNPITQSKDYEAPSLF